MGCDIHMRLEKINKDGEWETIDLFRPARDDEDEKYYPVTFPFVPAPIYDGRDYELFGVLAGIRCSYAEPISEPRGIPISANYLIRSEYEACKSECHTPNYLTLGELEKVWYAHIHDDPKDEEGYDNVYIRLFHNIIRPIENRLRDLHYVWSDTDAELVEDCRKYWDTVRIVFWFDS